MRNKISISKTPPVEPLTWRGVSFALQQRHNYSSVVFYSIQIGGFCGFLWFKLCVSELGKGKSLSLLGHSLGGLQFSSGLKIFY